MYIVYVDIIRLCIKRWYILYSLLVYIKRHIIMISIFLVSLYDAHGDRASFANNRLVLSCLLIQCRCTPAILSTVLQDRAAWDYHYKNLHQMNGHQSLRRTVWHTRDLFVKRTKKKKNNNKEKNIYIFIKRIDDIV